MAGAAIQGGIELENKGVKKAAKEAVIAERKNSSRVSFSFSSFLPLYSYCSQLKQLKYRDQGVGLKH